MGLLYDVKKIEKEYDMGEIKIKALNDVNVQILENETVTILGPSGSGKTTLLNMLSGLDKVDSGEIIFLNNDITKYNDVELTKYRRDYTGFIFQSYNLVSSLTVRENVELGAYLSSNKLDVDEIIEKVGLKDHANKFPFQLSGGQQQRVAIARVLVKNPKVIFCDEPTGALDEKSGREVLELLQKLTNEYNTTLIMVTHNPNIADMSHKVIYFRDGKIIDIVENKKILSAFEIEWS